MSLEKIIFILAIILFIILFRRRRIYEPESSREWYQRMLDDPRWERKRNRILKRDKYTCKRCGNKHGVLHVHHLQYEGRPWEVPDSWLITLCEDCHEEEH